MTHVTSVRQKVNHVSSVQLRRSLRAFKDDKRDLSTTDRQTNRQTLVSKHSMKSRRQLKCQQRLKGFTCVQFLSGNPSQSYRNVTCHKRSDSVTYKLTQMNALGLTPAR